MPPLLTLYGHSYCHLCTEMQAALGACRERWAFDLRLVDIEGNSTLETEFGERVPVLKLGSKEICHYFLDEVALADVLADAPMGIKS